MEDLQRNYILGKGELDYKAPWIGQGYKTNPFNLEISRFPLQFFILAMFWVLIFFSFLQLTLFCSTFLFLPSSDAELFNIFPRVQKVWGLMCFLYCCKLICSILLLRGVWQQWPQPSCAWHTSPHCREISTQICLLCLPSISFTALQTVKGLIKFRVCVFANLTWVHSQWNQSFIRTGVRSRANHYLSPLQTLQWLACIVSVCKVFYFNWFSIKNVVSSCFLVTRMHCLAPFDTDTKFANCSFLHYCKVEGPGSAGRCYFRHLLQIGSYKRNVKDQRRDGAFFKQLDELSCLKLWFSSWGLPTPASAVGLRQARRFLGCIESNFNRQNI